MPQLRGDLPLAILSFLVLLLPLYRAAALEDSFITPKVFLVQVCALVALVGAAFQRRSDGETNGGSLRNSVTIAFAILVAVHALSLLWARSAALGLEAVVYWTTFLMLHITFVCCVRGAAALNLLFGSGAIAAVLTAAWTIFEDATHGSGFGEIVPRLPDWRGHLAAGLGNSGHIAGFMGLFLPWMLWRFFTARSRASTLLLLAGLTLMAMAFVVTWSVGSSTATLASLAIWVLIAWSMGAVRQFHISRVALLLLPLAVACGIYFLPHALNPHSPSLWKEAFHSERWAEGWPTRVVIWKTTLFMIQHHLGIGIGAGNFTLEYVRQVVPTVVSDPALRVYAGAFTNDAHNEYLQVLCETGLPGLTAFLLLIAAFYRRILRGVRPLDMTNERWLLLCAGAGFTVFLLDALMTFPLRLPAHFAAFALFTATPIVLTRRDAARRWRVSRAAPVMCAVVVLVCAAMQLRRVMAEYHLKTGRTTIETTPLTISGQMMPQWGLADSFMKQALISLAHGDKQQMQTSLNQAGAVARSGSAGVAEREFHTALRWDPRYSNASSRLGALLMMQGKYAESIRVTRQTLRDLESSEIYERLGFAHYLQSNWTEAAKAWQVCLARRPVQWQLYEALLRQIPKP
jgi:O-antigen ligase/Tfp pilus assembly protein PilF